MKQYKICLLLGFIFMFIFAYIEGFYDDAFKKFYYTEIWYKNVSNSLIYYVFWVLPYWLLMIFIGAFVLSFLFYGIWIMIDKLKSSTQ